MASCFVNNPYVFKTCYIWSLITWIISTWFATSRSRAWWKGAGYFLVVIYFKSFIIWLINDKLQIICCEIVTWKCIVTKMLVNTSLVLEQFSQKVLPRQIRLHNATRVPYEVIKEVWKSKFLASSWLKKIFITLVCTCYIIIKSR